MVGIPDKPLPHMSAGLVDGSALKLSGNHLGNHGELTELLNLPEEKGVKLSVEAIPISEEGLKKAVERVNENKIKNLLLDEVKLRPLGSLCPSWRLGQ